MGLKKPLICSYIHTQGSKEALFCSRKHICGSTKPLICSYIHTQGSKEALFCSRKHICGPTKPLICSYIHTQGSKEALFCSRKHIWGSTKPLVCSYTEVFLRTPCTKDSVVSGDRPEASLPANNPQFLSCPASSSVRVPHKVDRLLAVTSYEAYKPLG
jgi:hypothetical protein